MDMLNTSRFQVDLLTKVFVLMFVSLCGVNTAKSSEMAAACYEAVVCNTMALSCNDEQIIRLVDQQYNYVKNKENHCNTSGGNDSKCNQYSLGNCCVIKNEKCMAPVSKGQTLTLFEKCSGKQSCSTQATQGRIKGCKPINNTIADSNFLTYDCDNENDTVQLCSNMSHTSNSINVIFNGRSTMTSYTTSQTCSCSINSTSQYDAYLQDVRSFRPRNISECSSISLNDTEEMCNGSKKDDFIYQSPLNITNHTITARNLFSQGPDDRPTMLWIRIKSNGNGKHSGPLTVTCTGATPGDTDTSTISVTASPSTSSTSTTINTSMTIPPSSASPTSLPNGGTTQAANSDTSDDTSMTTPPSSASPTSLPNGGTTQAANSDTSDDTSMTTPPSTSPTSLPNGGTTKAATSDTSDGDTSMTTPPSTSPTSLPNGGTTQAANSDTSDDTSMTTPPSTSPTSLPNGGTTKAATSDTSDGDTSMTTPPSTSPTSLPNGGTTQAANSDTSDDTSMTTPPSTSPTSLPNGGTKQAATSDTSDGTGVPSTAIVVPIVLVLLVLAAGVGIWYWRRKRQGRHENEQNSKDNKTYGQKNGSLISPGKISMSRLPDTYIEFDVDQGDEYSTIDPSQVKLSLPNDKVTNDGGDDNYGYAMPTNAIRADNTEYNVVNLKSKPVVLDPNYSHLPGTKGDEDDEYSHINGPSSPARPAPVISDSSADVYSHLQCSTKTTAQQPSDGANVYSHLKGEKAIERTHQDVEDNTYDHVNSSIKGNHEEHTAASMTTPTSSTYSHVTMPSAEKQPEDNGAESHEYFVLEKVPKGEVAV